MPFLYFNTIFVFEWLLYILCEIVFILFNICLKMVQIKELFKTSRFPSGWRLLTFLIYLPVGVVLAVLRLFIGIQAILAALLLPKVPIFRTFVLRTMCAVLGIVVMEENVEHKDESVRVIISNHVSIFDHLYLHLLTGSVSPSVWELPQCFHHALNILDFGKLKEKDVLVNNIKIQLNKDVCPIDIQPEGDTTSGKKALLRFSSWPFSIGSCLQPVTIRLWRPPVVDITPSVVAAPWFSDFLWFLFVPATVAVIRYLPKVEQQENESEEEFCKRVEKLIANDLGIETSSHTAADKVEFVKRLLTVQLTRQTARNIYNDPVLCDMANKVKEILPHVPVSAIKTDLCKTRNVDITVSNFLEGLVRFTPEVLPRVRTPTKVDKTSLEVSPNSSSTSSSSSSSSVKLFPKSAQDRMLSFQERKAILIEAAKKRYLEKHALNIVSS